MNSKLIKELESRLHFWFDRSILNVDVNDLLLNIEWDSIIEVFAEDYQRYFPGKELSMQMVETRIELIGILLYRIASNIYTKNKDDSKAESFSNLGRLISGFEIYYSAQIGSGLKINHGLGTVIGARVAIGENALIHQGVTFGDKGGKRPVLGNNITVYAGSSILGGIYLEDNCIVGANTLCLQNVPSGATIVGVPGKIISK